MTDLFAAMNYRYYLDRLEDPGLLNEALISDCGGLAVPVGGTRLGGWTSVASAAEGEQLIARMRELPERFPHPRFAYDGRVVAFGGKEPDDDEAAGRYYGYSESAIATFMQKISSLQRKRS